MRFPRLYRQRRAGLSPHIPEPTVGACSRATEPATSQRRYLVRYGEATCVSWSSTTPRTHAISPRARCSAPAIATSPPPIRRGTRFKLPRRRRRPQRARRRVDLILLDIVMPEIDGIEACARIRSDLRYADIPIIMVTSLGDMDSLANAFVAGANDYITKPVNRVELLARVRSALKLKAELERRQARERELLTFLSSWGDRRAIGVDRRGRPGCSSARSPRPISPRATSSRRTSQVSLLALAVDRLDSYRDEPGRGGGARHPRARGAGGARGRRHHRRRSAPPIATASSSWSCRTSAPAPRSTAWRELCARRSPICGIANPESIAADHVTASVAAVSGHVRRGIGRVHLLTHAISSVKERDGRRRQPRCGRSVKRCCSAISRVHRQWLRAWRGPFVMAVAMNVLVERSS